MEAAKRATDGAPLTLLAHSVRAEEEMRAFFLVVAAHQRREELSSPAAAGCLGSWELAALLLSRPDPPPLCSSPPSCRPAAGRVASTCWTLAPPIMTKHQHCLRSSLPPQAGGWLGRVYLLDFGTAGIDQFVSLGSPHLPPPAGVIDQTRGILTWWAGLPLGLLTGLRALLLCHLGRNPGPAVLKAATPCARPIPSCRVQDACPGAYEPGVR